MKEPKSTTNIAVVAPAPAMGAGEAPAVRMPSRGLGEAVMPATITGIVAIE
ncbi:hypothetical protein [Nonomuraea turcica]|uniref:hypothetical protein n=1 Tax=Nonomuraea sp. G32 TaxID=3067274 RepID=UPI00273C13DF|nr:hypothetical protein [Nonomuraea sp. G32]MDP4510711.1 hypothetical protein [Nonomuraea sp. G32]